MTHRTDTPSPTPPDKNRLWEIYLQKNPHWASEGVHLTPEGLRKFVEQVWQHGYNRAVATTKVTME